MDVRGPVGSQNVSWGFAIALRWAVLEWSLMFMLFIDATFSYLVTKFARYYKLQIPCLLCSRLDHVIGKERIGFYWDLVCGNHKSEISSLVHCHIHNKLVDVHGTCENCFLSFFSINNSNAESCRLLVGKVRADPHVGLDHDPLLFKDHSRGSSNTQVCSCCNEEWISRGYAHNILHSTSIGSLADELDVPLFMTIEQKKSRDELSVSYGDSHMGKNGFDHLSCTEYPASALSPQTVDPKDDLTVQHEQLVADDLASEKLIHPDSAPQPLVFEPTDLEVVKKPHTSTANAAAIGHGLEELISFDEQMSRETLDASEEASEMGKKLGTDSGDISKAEHEPIMMAETHIEVNPVTNDTVLQMPNYLDLGDAYKLAVGNKGRQLSGKFSEQRSLKDSLSITEDLKLLLSQRSFARGLEQPLNDMSPRVSGNIDELKTPDASTAVVMQLLQKRISLERNESNLSLDGSAVSDIEGESVVDRLNRQVEHDRKLMGALYKELEEERNASAIATNQAMAMITRLQEEKAALNMEALQCLRVMEDQAEYDAEALEKANNLLAEKEMKIRDIEAELELYRNKFGDISMLENMTEPSCERNSSSVSGNGKHNERCEIDGTEALSGNKDINAAKSSLLEFEDERLYVFQRLKKLEKELHLFSNNTLYLDTATSEFSGSFQENNGGEEDNLQEDDVIIYKENDGDLAAIRKEFYDLRGRLEALDADRSFLEHSINSLRNGDDGVKFVEEIACHLRELHKIGIIRRDQPSA